MTEMKKPYLLRHKATSCRVCHIDKQLKAWDMLRCVRMQEEGERWELLIVVSYIGKICRALVGPRTSAKKRT